ncbi:hypothetical protein [Liberibacter crescens]|nr:hypothetical protein [Liberibacter crescens]AMC12647.1 hypothetical protein RL73_02550 [Liberibacter crescens]
MIPEDCLREMEFDLFRAMLCDEEFLRDWFDRIMEEKPMLFFEIVGAVLVFVFIGTEAGRYDLKRLFQWVKSRIGRKKI